MGFGPLLHEGLGSEVTKRAVGPVGVVLDSPVLGQDLGLEQRVELFGDEELVAESAVEGFSERVLPRRAGIDERGLDAGEPAPVPHRVRGELGAVVHPDVGRPTAGLGDHFL